MSNAYPPPMTRRFVTAAATAATMLTSIDTTIANVALPRMQGSLSASAEEITWVLTSYIVATAIFMSLSGWLAGRFGRRQVILWSVVGFTVMSALCGLATDLDAIVVFRFLQGAFGATLPPISQSIMLDINPPERRAHAMSIWSLGSIVAPILGPALGGWLTDNVNWRWVFFINLPFGVLSFAGLFFFLSETRKAERARLDFFGFAMIAIAVSSFQLLLDRGQIKDWFGSSEIWIEATIALLFGYLFFVHTCTAQQPFLPPALCRDSNFLFGTVLGFFVGVTIFSMLTLQPPMLEDLMGYPVLLTGLVTAPRGFTAFASVFIAGRLMKLVDSRLLIFVGFMLLAMSTYHVTAVSLQMDQSLILGTSLIQGLGTGFVFVPLATLSFSTLPPHLRDEGAAIYTLLRNLGGAFGIAIIQAMTVRNAATVHSRLVEAIRPDNPLMAYAVPGFDFNAPVAVARMNAEITRQASMVAYADAFWLLFILTAAVTPFLLLMRNTRSR